MSVPNGATETKPSRLWAFVIIFLLVLTAGSIIIAMMRYRPARAIEINLPTTTQTSGNLQIGRAVTNPGIYPFNTDDTIGGLVLNFEKGDISFLLTADITEATETELLMARADIEADVLKVAHHGSATATGTAFLVVVKPTIAVISVGAENIYRTDLNGTIEFTTDDKQWWISKAKE
jgi:hypothetical protein